MQGPAPTRFLGIEHQRPVDFDPVTIVQDMLHIALDAVHPYPNLGRIHARKFLVKPAFIQRIAYARAFGHCHRPVPDTGPMGIADLDAQGRLWFSACHTTVRHAA